MNTIEITTDNNVINYTELDVKRFIEKAGQLSDVKYKVRDFFSEREWENSATTVTRSEVNELFSEIGIDLLRGKFRATVTITAYVTDYPAESEDEASECIADDLELSIGSSGLITVDNIDVDDVEEDD